MPCLVLDGGSSRFVAPAQKAGDSCNWDGLRTALCCVPVWLSLEWEALLMVTHALVISWMHYCNLPYMGPSLKKPQLVQYRKASVGAECSNVGSYVFPYKGTDYISAL